MMREKERDEYYKVLVESLVALPIVKDSSYLEGRLIHLCFHPSRDNFDEIYALCEDKSFSADKHFFALLSAALEAAGLQAEIVDEAYVKSAYYNYLCDLGNLSVEDREKANKKRIEELEILIKDVFLNAAAQCEVELSSLKREIALLQQEHEKLYEQVVAGEEVRFSPIEMMPNLYKLSLYFARRAEFTEFTEAECKLYGWKGGLFQQFIKTSTASDLQGLLEKVPYAAYLPISPDCHFAHFYIALVEGDEEKLKVIFCKGAAQFSFFSLDDYDVLSYLDSEIDVSEELYKTVFSLSDPMLMKQYMIDLRGESFVRKFLEKLSSKMFYANLNEGHPLADFLAKLQDLFEDQGLLLGSVWGDLVVCRSNNRHYRRLEGSEYDIADSSCDKKRKWTDIIRSKFSRERSSSTICPESLGDEESANMQIGEDKKQSFWSKYVKDMFQCSLFK